VDRAAFIEELKAENIGTSVHFIPIHYHPYFRERMNHPRGSFPVAETAFDELVSLPIYPAMSDDDVEDAITAVRKVAAHFSR
jgi:dTDP-4-amino-4,6-dideoxygalactose transaminase